MMKKLLSTMHGYTRRPRWRSVNDRERLVIEAARELQVEFGMRPREAREAAQGNLGLHAEAELIRESSGRSRKTLEEIFTEIDEREAQRGRRAVDWNQQ